MITIPMERKVPEKPSPITPGMLASGMPAAKANSRDTSMMERKACTLSLEISRIMSAMATTNAMINGIPVT
jgi:hypothetical protein